MRGLNTEQADVKAVIAKNRFVAPISGTVISPAVAPGETINEGATLLAIADLRCVRVEAEVDEFDAGRIHRGSDAVSDSGGVPRRILE